MKKIALLFGLILLNACTSSDDNGSSEGPLLKEVHSETVSGDHTSNVIIKFAYTGNKIKSVKHGTNWETKYTYSGGSTSVTTNDYIYN